METLANWPHLGTKDFAGLRVKRVRFDETDSEPLRVAYEALERMFALFQMISPKYWIFTTSQNPGSSQHTFEQSYFSQRLNIRHFQGHVWTNLEHKFDLRAPQGYSQMLTFDQLRNNLAQDESHQDRAVYPPIPEFTMDYDKDHPVYAAEGVWASHSGAKRLNLNKLQRLS